MVRIVKTGDLTESLYDHEVDGLTFEPDADVKPKRLRSGQTMIQATDIPLPEVIELGTPLEETEF